MAKTRMICPFSDEICRECALYRGRHYFLCFCEKYRGYLEEPKEINKFSNLRVNSNGEKFEMPSLPTRTKDPYIDSL